MHVGARIRVLWRQQPGLFRGYVVDVATAITLGVLTIVGGNERATGPAWVTLNASGGPRLWGTILLLSGVVLVAAAFAGPVAMQWALLVSGAVYGLFAWWFLTGAAFNGASFWGAVLCSRAAIMHVSRSESYRAGPTT